MTAELTVDVLGAPKPQGSKRGFIVQGKGSKQRAVVVDTNKKPLRDWRSDVIGAVRDAWAGREPIDDPVFVHLEFRLPRPKAGKARFPAGRVGDLDKLTRTILDALEIAGAVTDDSRVCTITASKAYPTAPSVPGVRIVMGRIDAEATTPGGNL